MNYEDEYKENEFCVAKRNAYMRTIYDGNWIDDLERTILTKDKQYLITKVGKRSITVINDDGRESVWTFTGFPEEKNYTFPFYTKEELREHRLNNLIDDEE